MVIAVVELWGADADEGALEYEESVVVVVLPVLVEVGLPSSEFPSPSPSSRSRLSNESGLLSARRMKWGSMPERVESLRPSDMLMMSADCCLLRERYSGGIAASAIASKSMLVMSDCEEMERAGGRRGERTGRIGGGGVGVEPEVVVVAVATRSE